MKRTQLYVKTAKTTPASEVSKNAQLLLRAGFIYKVMAGAYAYTPLGLQVLENIKRIVREEMNAVGGQEVTMTSLQRPETWQSTGRWSDDVVDVWFKTRLHDGSELGLAWSHEEAIMEMMQQFIHSYKDLPQSVYQFQTKMRNELRAKSGIMRGREFIMKDMYSLHATEQDCSDYYNKVMAAYQRCYDRLGIGGSTFITFASGGAFTQFSHEFQTICEAGEDEIYVLPSTKTAYNAEIAPVRVEPNPAAGDAMQPLQMLDDPTVVGADALVKALQIPRTASTKSLLYETSAGLVMAVVRSDRDINEDKLRIVAGVDWLRLASEAVVEQATGAKIGFAGLYNLPEGIRAIVDDSCQDMVNFETGANQTGQHVYNANWERDIPRPSEFVDIKQVRQGDVSPETGEVYERYRTAEVGNIFNFGTQKSEEMGIYYTAADGSQQPIYLASYGIGVTRVMGVIAEKLADDKGLVWPAAIAPAVVYLVRIGSQAAAGAADELYNSLMEQGVSVLYDDREARPGEKFADGELMGLPYMVTVSDRLVKAGTYELKDRRSGEVRILTRPELLATIKSY